MMDCFLELMAVCVDEAVVVFGFDADCCLLLMAFATALNACDSDFCVGDFITFACLIPPVLCTIVLVWL